MTSKAPNIKIGSVVTPSQWKSSYIRTALCCSLPILSAATPIAAIAQSKPNVVIMLLDDIGYGDLQCLGNTRTETPYLDKLWAESVRFTDFHVSPMSTPTRGQLLTGRHCLENEADMVCAGRSVPRPDFPMLSEVFKANGYATGMFGKWHLGENAPFRPSDRGFDESLYFPGSSLGTARDYWNNDGFDCTVIHQNTRKKYDGYITDVWNDQAIEWMQQQQKDDKPFFCYLPSNLVHGPEFVEEEFKEYFAAKNYTGPYPTVYAALKRYDGICARVDAFLEKSGLRENTIVIFLSDNGATDVMAKVDNAGMRGYKTSLYDGGHRVPCFVRWPKNGWDGGRDFDKLTEVQDIFPTLVEACSLKETDKLQLTGTSLVAALEGKDMPILDDRICFVQYGKYDRSRLSGNNPVIENVPCGPVYGDAAVLWQNWRLVHNNELYNISTDPGQEINLSGKEPKIVEKLQAAYNKWWSDISPEGRPIRAIPIGIDNELVKLDVSSWEGAWIDFSGAIRSGLRINGAWNLDVACDGVYRVYLRRWPEELGLPIRSAAPEFKPHYREGKALDVSKIRIEIQGQTLDSDVSNEDISIQIDIPLKKGVTKIKTYMMNADGETLAGVYYTDIKFIE